MAATRLELVLAPAPTAMGRVAAPPSTPSDANGISGGITPTGVDTDARATIVDTGATAGCSAHDTVAVAIRGPESEVRKSLMRAPILGLPRRWVRILNP
jgi:hypothetical protein